MATGRIVKATQDATTTEWVVRLLSTGEEIARFDSLHLARQCVNRINNSATAFPAYNR